MACNTEGTLSRDMIEKIMSQKLRIEKVAIKDIKLRTFIAEGESRNDLAAHVYDVTYGIVGLKRFTIDALNRRMSMMRILRIA